MIATLQCHETDADIYQRRHDPKNARRALRVAMHGDCPGDRNPATTTSQAKPKCRQEKLARHSVGGFSLSAAFYPN